MDEPSSFKLKAAIHEFDIAALDGSERQTVFLRNFDRLLELHAGGPEPDAGGDIVRVQVRGASFDRHSRFLLGCLQN